MELFLIRHADAAPKDEPIDDAARPLTKEGKKRLARAARGMKRLGLRFDRVLHSPWLRAVETADALAPLLAPDAETVVSPHLVQSPGREMLGELSGARVAVVGHRPWLNEMLALLVVGTTEHAPRFPLEKGGVAWLEGEPRPGGMSIKALLPPEALGEIRRPRKKARS